MQAPAFALGQARRGAVLLPALVAVAEHHDGTIWLVDAGWDAETCCEPSRLGWLQRRMLGVRLSPGDDVASHLRQAGLDPSRVSAIVATHLHLDHVAGVRDFPNAELIATRSEYNQAMQSSWRRGYRREDLERASRLRLVDMQPESRVGFLRSCALTEDVLMLDAAGHTTGHAAVLLREQDRQWLVAGDAAYVRTELDQRPGPLSRMMAHDRQKLHATHQTLRQAERDHACVLAFSHDGAGFAALPKLVSP